MDIGYRQTIDYFDFDLMEKKKIIVKYYRDLSNQINKVKKSIFANKISHAQNQLGLLYMDFCDSRKYVDLRYYEMIDDFKINFMSNVVAAPLFGVFRLNNSNEIKKQVALLSVEFEEKVMELESFIFKL